MISVIVPYKNSKEWIGRCIKSLKIQTAGAEFILVNDHSNDGGDTIAKELVKEDPRFRVVNNSKKAGVSGARNTGIEAAKGDWITFLDADDEMLPDGLNVYERLIAQEKSAQIHQANHLRYYAKIDKTALKYANEAGNYGLNNLPVVWCMVWNKVYSSTLLIKNKIRFDEALRYGEDEIFNLECLSIEKRIHHGPRQTQSIRRHFDNPESLAHIKNDKDLLKQSQALEKFIKNHNDPEIRKVVCMLLSNHWSSRTYLNAFTGGETK